jgi:hypothetical protein
LNLHHIIDPIPKGGVEEEEETSYPEKPALPTSQEYDADHNGWYAKGIHNPSVLEGIAFKEESADRKMNDQHNLEEECPSHEQSV